MWYSKKSGVTEKYVRVVQNMTEDSVTVARRTVAMAEGFKMEMGLQQ